LTGKKRGRLLCCTGGSDEESSVWYLSWSYLQNPTAHRWS
jgi:hypothetical protein